MADGTTHEFRVPIIHLNDYTLDDIFEKKMIFLLPFYLLRYEKWFRNLDELPDMQEQIIYDFTRIHLWLTTELGESKQETSINLRQVIMDVVHYLLRPAKSTEERIGDIMGGQVLELYTEKLAREANERLEKSLAEAKAQAIAQGIAQGVAQGYSEGISQGISQGKLDFLTELIEAKVKAGKSLEQTAAEVEQSVEDIKEIYESIANR